MTYKPEVLSVAFSSIANFLLRFRGSQASYLFAVMDYPLLQYLQLFLLIITYPATAQSAGPGNGNITIGASLSATNDGNSSWLSPSADFALGFREINNQFLLSIWYAKLTDKTIVWYANEGKLVEKGSSLKLTSDQGLVLTDPKGDQLWRSEVSSLVAYGFMNDSGNFVLKDTNSRDVWSSFMLPTDTMLPNQVIEREGMLSSRKTKTDFSLGRFQLKLLGNGNLVLRTLNPPTNNANDDPYYETKTGGDTNSSIAGFQVFFNESGNIYLVRANGERLRLTETNVDFENSNFYHRATLDFDGIFTQYYHPKNFTGEESWSVLWSVPENICRSVVQGGTSICGFNSICSLGTNQRPTCECPPGYSLLDPNDQFGSCKLNFTLGCDEDDERYPAEDLYDIEVLPNTDWPFSDYMKLTPVNEGRCKDSCLHDCMCAAAIYRGSYCWKKRLPLSNGRVGGGEVSTAFLKIRKGKNYSSHGDPCISRPDGSRKRNQETTIIVGSVFLGSSFFLNLVLAIAICLGLHFVKKKRNTRNPQGDTIVETNLRCFSYEEVWKATNGFKEEIGRGSFGIVYKGQMNIFPKDVIAVKKLDRVIQEGEGEFKAEVNVIGQTHHKNLVRLLGFCKEGTHRLLVYEFMSNGTLASFLFGDSKPIWKQRIQIAVGIARGLLYLHEECSNQIIHCDIKPQNILLDEYYNARISDFGLAKLLKIDQSRTLTSIRGTKGYVAPEWFRSTPINGKVDVYSFGVLLLEIISCRRSVDMENMVEENAILIDWAYDCYSKGRLVDLVEGDMEAIGDQTKLERLVMVAIWCIQEDPSLRPTMRMVTQMLDGVIEVTLPPCPFLFSSYK